MFFKYGGIQLDLLLPFFVDDGDLLPEMKNRLFLSYKGNDLLIIKDNPVGFYHFGFVNFQKGFWKNYTPSCFCSVSECWICSFRTKYKSLLFFLLANEKHLESSVLSSIESTIERVLNQKFPNGGKESEIISEMENVFLYGLTHIFTEYGNHFETKFLYSTHQRSYWWL